MLNTAQGKAASFARSHAEANEQLRQQATLLDQRQHCGRPEQQPTKQWQKGLPLSITIHQR
ncbi:TPA: hypothetical protein ACH3X3_010375 [Trebouxia sp. C0006]